MALFVSVRDSALSIPDVTLDYRFRRNSLLVVLESQHKIGAMPPKHQNPTEKEPMDTSQENPQNTEPTRKRRTRQTSPSHDDDTSATAPSKKSRKTKRNSPSADMAKGKEMPPVVIRARFSY